MYEIVGSLKSLINGSKVCIDNNVFRLHYRLTVLLLVLLSVLVTSKQYIGDPIDCISDETIKNIMDQYCWIHSTYTIIGMGDPKTHTTHYQGVEDEDDSPIEAHPGISHIGKHDKLHYRTHYQWVWCILFIQAIFFYLPHWLWKSWDGGRIEMLVADLNSYVLKEDQGIEKKRIILDKFASNQGDHTLHALQFYLCEFLNFVNVIIQIFLTDAFLGHEFTTYGFKVLEFARTKPYQRTDPMARVFPTVTSCEINRFHRSGKIVNHYALCILPINILNEKIYIFLWFWFILLAILSGIALVYRIINMLSNCLRKFILKKGAHLVHSTVVIDAIVDNYNLGDWFLLSQLERNMYPDVFGVLLRDLAKRDKYPTNPDKKDFIA